MVGIAIHGFPDLAGAAGAILLPDPFSFPTDLVLHDLAQRAAGVPVVGGVASARMPGGEGALLLHGYEVVTGGAVGVRLDGVELSCAEAIADVIAEDSGIPDEQAMLLGVGLAGMAQITARHWLAAESDLERDAASALVSALAWRGIGSLPRTGGERSEAAHG